MCVIAAWFTEKSRLTDTDVTCHMGSQRYLPPDTSERMPRITPAASKLTRFLEGWKAELT